MGNEAQCVVKNGDKKVAGKALLETSELIFRSESLRLKIPFAQMKSVKAVNRELRVRSPDGSFVFELGPCAEKWAHKILNPKSRAEKLGIKQNAKITVIGKTDPGFAAELAKLSADFHYGEIANDTEWIFLFCETQKDLAKASSIAKVMRGALALWIVYPKGRKDITEMDVLSSGRKAGLKDVKVVGFSSMQTALKFVIPVNKR
ncbi:MAG: hypothetical protein JSS69_09255 [Acidobacteria bacterium]|nr:hypothetical protein [Acidobacteriota bacterium]MBS1866093.1 hypothetical protein [Acidobacteriota bacterium]